MKDLMIFLGLTCLMVALIGIPYAAAWWSGRNYHGPRGRGLVQPKGSHVEYRG